MGLSTNRLRRLFSTSTERESFGTRNSTTRGSKTKKPSVATCPDDQTSGGNFRTTTSRKHTAKYRLSLVCTRCKQRAGVQELLHQFVFYGSTHIASAATVWFQAHKSCRSLATGWGCPRGVSL